MSKFLTPAVASAIMAMRHNPLSYDLVTDYSQITPRGTYKYRIGYRVVTRKTAMTLSGLTDWIKDGALTDLGRRVFVDGCEAVILDSDEDVQNRINADKHAHEQASLERFKLSFPNYYLSPSIDTIWKVNTYEEFHIGWNDTLWCPITGEPVLPLPPPSDETQWSHKLIDFGEWSKITRELENDERD